MGDFLKRLPVQLRRILAPFTPRCFVLVIFGDGSYLVTRYSRLEPAREEIAIEGDQGRCRLTADLGGLRVYRYVRAVSPTKTPERMGLGMIQ